MEFSAASLGERSDAHACMKRPGVVLGNISVLGANQISGGELPVTNSKYC